ncbi:pentatricopeptide repeat-containing protein [Panicum miliaceum]|uniref:Pentatricopeptide repeat-containing protein n=1 Tax=Panicum miliaceum TaxID=4540 RepID=A0A3L6SG15_PANMI|nr:pentatricopeptide repeat-containing protein [Panicum miliaceum]
MAVPHTSRTETFCERSTGIDPPLRAVPVIFWQARSGGGCTVHHDAGGYLRRSEPAKFTPNRGSGCKILRQAATTRVGVLPMLRRCRRRRVLPLLSQCSPVRRRSTFAKLRPPPRRRAHINIRSSNDDPLALARRRGTTAGRALFELPFQCSLLRLHGTVAVPHATPRQPAHDGVCSTSENPAAPEQQRGAAGTRAVLKETPNRDAVSYAAKVALHLQHRNLPRAEALFRAAPAALGGSISIPSCSTGTSRLGVSTARASCSTECRRRTSSPVLAWSLGTAGLAVLARRAGCLM